jgi:hypothetical protein
MTEEHRQDFLKALYFTLWQSADFETDFQSAWFAVWQLLSEGKEKAISDTVLEMVELWFDDWFKEAEKESEEK